MMQYFKRTREVDTPLKLPKGDLLPQYNKQSNSLNKFKSRFNYESSFNKFKSMLKNFDYTIILFLFTILFIMLSVFFDTYNVLMLFYEILIYQHYEFIDLCYIMYHGLSILNIFFIVYFVSDVKNNKLYYYVVFNIAYYVFLLSSNNFHELFSDNLENIKNLFQIGMIIYIVKLKYEQWLRG